MTWYRCGNGGSGGAVGTILKGTNKPQNTQGANGQVYLRNIAIPSGVDIRASISNSAVGDYFDTGYLFNENTRIEAKFNVSSGAQFPTPFGCRRDGSGTDPYQLFFALSGHRLYYAFGSSENPTDDFFDYNYDTEIIAVEGVCKQTQNGRTKYKLANTYSQDGTLNLYLFCANLGGSPWSSSWAIMTLYYFKIFEGDEPVHYFLPCVDGNNEPCLYDAVTGDYLYNQGSGTLTVGSSVTPNDEILSAYAKVSDNWQSLVGTDVDDITDAQESILEYKQYMKFNGHGVILPWTLNSDYKVEVVFCETTYNNDSSVIGNSFNASRIHLTTYSSKYYCSKGDSEGNFGTWSSGEHTFVCNNGNSHNEFDGVEVTDYTPATVNDIYYTLGCRGADDWRNAYYGWIKSFRIYSISTGDLLHELLPCKILNQSCFIDTVEDKIYCNQSIQAVDTVS